MNIASITGVAGSPGQVAYSSTKGAVIALTKSAAKELSPMNIRVNAVAPGIIATERFKELYENDGDKIDQRISRIALGGLVLHRMWLMPSLSWLLIVRVIYPVIF